MRVKREKIEDKNNEEMTKCILTIKKCELAEKKMKKDITYWKKSALKSPLFSDLPTPYVKTGPVE